jgi:protein SMG6
MASDADEFSRRPRLAPGSPPDAHAHAHSRKHPHPDSARKLYNPHADPIPTRHALSAEPDSDVATSSSYARLAAPRPLFDPRKDDPVRFAVLARPTAAGPPHQQAQAQGGGGGGGGGGGRAPPTPKSSGDWVSASSTSSYTPSLASSSFTLSSGTTASSQSSAIFDHSRPRTEESGTNAFSIQLKRLYREITALEAKIMADDAAAAEPEVGRVIVKGGASAGAGAGVAGGGGGAAARDPQIEAEKWKKATVAHKRYVSSLRPLRLRVPAYSFLFFSRSNSGRTCSSHLICATGWRT